MTDRELMQQALDAMLNFPNDVSDEMFESIRVLRARLNGWEKLNMNDHKEGDLGIGMIKWDASAPLVVHPHPAFQTTEPQREWIGLTDDEIMDACSAVWASHPIEVGQVVAAILKEKNGF